MVFRFLFVIFFCFSLNANSCQLNSKVISLSGPLTHIIEELNLLGDKNLRGISELTPLKSNTKIKKFSGGIFMSKKILKEYKDVSFLYDKSVDLTKTFMRSNIKNYIEIDTRNIDPFETVDLLLEKLKPFLSQCENRILLLKQKIKRHKSDLLGVKSKRKVVFFLGAISKNLKLPELVISNDGFVLFLKKHAMVETYNSTFSYVSWSHKEMNKMKGKYSLVGISDHEKNDVYIEKLKPLYVNIYLRGVLVPGLRQIDLLSELQKLALH